MTGQSIGKLRVGVQYSPDDSGYVGYCVRTKNFSVSIIGVVGNTQEMKSFARLRRLL